MTTSFVGRLMGADDGLTTLLVRLLLLPFSLLYGILVTARNALYDAGLLPTVGVDVPVVSVGNLTVGGTGKTPLVVALCRRALDAGKRVAVVTRGYGGPDDEVALIEARCPGVRVFVHPDKVSGARAAAAEGVDLILLDDGFQHRRLRRDLDIVVVDAREPFAGDNLLPGGGLREPASGLARADLLVLTHYEQLDVETRRTMLSRVRAFHRDLPLVLGNHEPRGVRPASGGEERSPGTLRDVPVHLFCGIGNPEGFRDTVANLGADVVGLTAFPDHHAFTAADLAEVRSRAGAATLLCTEKDAAKVARIPGSDDVLCLTVDLVLADESGAPDPEIPLL